ncbi:MAG TPA: cardiolipin synthase [Bacillus bacterium]|nr:cardiolipin synthase [Bacillus sp. (in: firmicutes)]
MTIILIFLLIFIAWLTIDFYFGRKNHLKNISKRNYPIRHGEWVLFTDGEKLYKNLFSDISNAKKHIHILFYIVKNDVVSQEFLKLLKEKAQEGVKVRLLLDRIGSRQISRKEIRSLRNSGVHFSFSNKPRFPYFFYSLNYRNHRKITVIDGTIGYFGGFNIGREYLGQDPYLGYWQDFHLKLVGDGVQDLQTEFLLDWEKATRENVLGHPAYFPKLPQGSLPLWFLPTDGAFIKDLLIELINKAKTEILIGTPYFIPGKEVLQAILEANRRGVNVTVLVPYKADHPFVKEATFPYFKDMLKAGCHIYHYTNGFYHGKLVLIDNELCDFGTANFDKRSFFINDELNCFIRDPIFIEKIRNEFLNDIFRQSEKFTLARFEKRPILQRGKELVSSLISDLL